MLATHSKGTIHDASFSSVMALLHMNGANAGTSFPDKAPTPLTYNATGDAKTTTADSKFNGSCAIFDGNGDYIGPTTAPNYLGAADFTIEFWFKAISGTIFDFDVGAATISLLLTDSGGGLSGFDLYNGSSHTGGSISQTVWNYGGVKRLSGTTSLWVGGSQQTSFADAVNYNAAATLLIGQNNGVNLPLNGKLAEFRITKGVARSLAVIPSEPWPNY